MRRAAKRDISLARQCVLVGLPTPTLEFRFAHPRRWRFDLSWEDDIRLAVEIEGGIFTGGRHTRGAGFEKDAEKYIVATLLGWKVIRVTTGMVRSGLALRAIQIALAPRGTFTIQDIIGVVNVTHGGTHVGNQLDAPTKHRHASLGKK